MDHIRDFVKNIRTDYNLDTLDIKTVESNPIAQFAIWMKMAVDAKVNEPNAFNLATVDENGKPSSRIVLLRNFDYDGFVFFTNYQSHKGHDLDHHKWAALNFFWPELHKQVRILGKAEKVDESDSEEYFNTRPRESQLGAWVSEQSRPLSGREELEQNLKNLTAQYEGKSIPRPAHWGGYRINPVEMEFWQGRPSRLHDRVKYELTADNNWKARLLYP
jgi:pyridoxamine 5'-phosphate oxidase